jgi:uncharacterized DUF497 family protein
MERSEMRGGPGAKSRIAQRSIRATLATKILVAIRALFRIYIKFGCASPVTRGSASERFASASLTSRMRPRCFAGLVVNIPDLRRDYGDPRINSVGHLRGRMVVICWTPHGDARHIISMRKANEREKARYRQRLEEG